MCVQGSVHSANGIRERIRSLFSRQGQGAHGYARLFPILEIAYELVSLGKTATQRDIFYRYIVAQQNKAQEDQQQLGHVVPFACSVTSMLGPCRLKTLDIYNSPEQVNQAIQDVAGMLEVHSVLLGFNCASRGAVYGPLLVKEQADGDWMDCSICARNIPGNCRAVAAFAFESRAKCEKAPFTDVLQEPHQKLLFNVQKFLF